MSVISDSNGLDQIDDVIYKNIPLRLNGSGTKFMSVNGSSTAQVFSFIPPNGQQWYIESLIFSIQDSGTPDPDDFGSRGGLLGGTSSLTNGLVLEVQLNDTVYEICNLEDNLDISNVFFSSYSQGSGAAWFNNSDGWIGELTFNQPLKLNGTNGDFIRFRVRDNLSSIDFLQTNVKCWRKR